MSLRLRLLVLLLAIYTAGGVLLTRWVLNQVRPRYLESMEESLVDTSVLLAGVLETQLAADPVDGEGLRRAFAAARSHPFRAQVFSLQKTAIDLEVYVTDDRGRVVFDSTGRDEGRDFSRWNDVAHGERIANPLVACRPRYGCLHVPVASPHSPATLSTTPG